MTRSHPSPFDAFGAIADDLIGSRPFEHLLGRLATSVLDTTETADIITVHLPLPGFKREHIMLQVAHEAADGVELTMVAVRHERKVEHTIVVGDHNRPVDPDGITSKLEDGILSITCRKRAATKPRRVEVG